MNKHVELLSVQPVVTGCEWSTDGESGMWETTCGKAFVFNEDGPIANGFEFCPFCGLSLDELPYQDADPRKEDDDDTDPMVPRPAG